MKFHTNLPVRDIEATTRFYSMLFNEAPVKKKDDYVKFLPTQVALNISFHQADTLPHTDMHVGFEAADQAELDSVYLRLKAAGMVEEQRDTSICCYANQDKFRVTDPDGYQWEIYVLLEDTALKIEKKTGCCAVAGAPSAPCC